MKRKSTKQTKKRQLATTRQLLVGLGLAMSLTSHGAVPVGDITLLPVVSDNLPVFYSLTGYVNTESRMGNGSDYEKPMYFPYNAWKDGTYNKAENENWWDNLLAEQLHARMPVIMLGSRGGVPGEVDGNGEPKGALNPYRLYYFEEALIRNGITPSVMKATCFVDTQPCEKWFPNDDANFANRNDALFAYFDRAILPWFDTVPEEYWFKVKMPDGTSRPLIQFWNFNAAWAKNTQNNISWLMTNITSKFNTRYGVKPAFNLPVALVNGQDTTIVGHPDVYGYNDWFSPSANDSWTLPVQPNVALVGHMVPGFKSGAYAGDLTPPLANFISRKGSSQELTPGGTNGATLLEGLNEAMLQRADVMSVEGWSDDVEFAGLYRSWHPNWDYPNQYINLMRRYNDLRTETLRLEFEGCDAYNDTTPTSNAGGVFRRNVTNKNGLDIQKMPASQTGWSVGWTAVGEWMEFQNVYLAPGTYTFPVKYAASSADRKVTLSLTGPTPISPATLPMVTLPSTGGTMVYDTHSLGTVTVPGGDYTIRLTTNTAGGLNLDWLFVKRKDVSVTLKSKQNNLFVRAAGGGGDGVAADRTSAVNHERFILCDRNGGSLSSGDFVNLQCHNGLFLSAVGQGGSDLTANKMAQATWERFQIVKASGTGTITNGTEVVFKSNNGTSYLNVNATTGVVDVRGTGVVNATRFTIGF